MEGEGYFTISVQKRIIMVTICPRVQSASGLKVVALVPPVISCSYAHWTAFA